MWNIFQALRLLEVEIRGRFKTILTIGLVKVVKKKVLEYLGNKLGLNLLLKPSEITGVKEMTNAK